MLAARQADIPDHAHESASGNQHAKAMPPHLVELVVKGVTIFDEPELAFMRGIFS